MEEDFFTIGLCFIEEGTRQFDNCPYDKITYRYMKSKYSYYQLTDLQQAFAICPQTLNIDQSIPDHK